MPHQLVSLSILFGILASSALTSAFAADGGGPPPATVRTVPVAQLPVQPTTTIVGSLQAAEQVNISAEESGILQAILVDEGDMVEKGMIIARLDGDRLLAQIAEAEASVVSHQAAVTQAQATRDLAKIEAEARTSALASKAIASIEANRATSAANVAQAGLSKSEADLNNAQAQLASLKVREADLTITAPFAGFVTRRHKDVGAWVSPGQTILSLSSTQLEIRAQVPERFYAGVKEHAQSLIATLQDNRQPLVSDQLRIVGNLDLASRTFPVLGIIKPQPFLAPGLSAQVAIPTGPEKPMLVVPSAAVLQGDGPPRVFVVQKTDQGYIANLCMISIITTCSNGLAIQPLQPQALQEGALVITEGNERIRPGSAVSLTSADVTHP